MAYTADQYGISGFTRLRRRKPGSQPTNLDVNSVGDTKPIRLNSREFTTDTGDAIGVQCKPNQTLTMTNRSVKGAEFSPRVTDAGLGSTGALIGLTADPLLKAATAARTVGSVRAIECNPGLPGSGSAYTVTDFSVIRVFLDKGVGHTVTNTEVIRVATPNNGTFDSFANFEANTGCISTVAAGAASNEWLLVKVGANIRKIALLAAS